ncbi:group-specific protein [Lysinibacillus louembei]|uniref:Group-specific protein n=1 Tax=Lysinibacillus louembei TaxID=1470088 RepID=A0ABZ0S404_9BACI|nr:group-specific protein [Lysinibacillus louembei]WPK12287.1 group-specific protein [Lysinibacillus louembei]
MGLIQFDEAQFLDMAQEEMRKEAKARLDQVENEFVFWDVNKLCEKTCMSRSFVFNTFFWLPDFPKKKVGGKWLMSPKKVAAYLETWLDKQP